MELLSRVTWNFGSFSHLEQFYWLKLDAPACVLALLKRNQRLEGSEICVSTFWNLKKSLSIHRLEVKSKNNS